MQRLSYTHAFCHDHINNAVAHLSSSYLEALAVDKVVNTAVSAWTGDEAIWSRYR